MVPSRLRIGDLVRIPKRLVRRFNSMPQDFVASFRSGVNQDSSKNGSTESSAQEDRNANRNQGMESDHTSDRMVEQNDAVVEDQAPTKYKEPDRNREEDFGSKNEPTQTETGVGNQIEDAPSKNTEPEVKPADAPPANDENKKVRDQLMQELLQ